jgi:hypothetical protein
MNTIIPDVRFNYTNTPKGNQYTAPSCNIQVYSLGNSSNSRNPKRENFELTASGLTPNNSPLPICNRLQGYPNVAVTSNFIRDRGIPTPYDIGFLPEYTDNTPAIQLFVRLGTDSTTGKKYFVINGKTSPRLLLTRGKKYQFNIVTECCPFYFSQKPFGQPDVFGIPPIAYDLRTYKITDNIPNKFYYTSTDSECLVGEVVIIN